jgi:hypothetical protein
MPKKKTKQNPEDVFTPFGDLQVSFFITSGEKNEDKIVLRLDDGYHEGTILEIKDFRFEDESKPILSFDMSIIHVPDDIQTNDKEIEKIVKKAVKRIIQSTLRTAMADETSNFVNI